MRDARTSNFESPHSHAGVALAAGDSRGPSLPLTPGPVAAPRDSVNPRFTLVDVERLALQPVERSGAS